jgi:hypothetical protein
MPVDNLIVRALGVRPHADRALGRAPEREVLEDRLGLSKHGELRVRPGDVVAPRRIAAGRYGEAHLHQTLRRLERQGPEEHRIHGAEDRGVRADPHGEREHGDRGEARGATERSERESHVLFGCVEESETSHLAYLFLGRREVAELPPSGRMGVRAGDRPAGGVLALHGVECEVEADLLVELSRVPPGMEQHPQAIAEDVQQLHA